MSGDDQDEKVHFLRTCAGCGEQWPGLHCPHDGAQNPCPACNLRPTTIPEPIEGCDCVFNA